MQPRVSSSSCHPPAPCPALHSPHRIWNKIHIAIKIERDKEFLARRASHLTTKAIRIGGLANNHVAERSGKKKGDANKQTNKQNKTKQVRERRTDKEIHVLPPSKGSTQGSDRGMCRVIVSVVVWKKVRKKNGEIGRRKSTSPSSSNSCQ